MKVCVGYISSSEPLYLNASLNAMLEHEWVDKIIVVLTNVDGITTKSVDGRVIIYRKNFGVEGFEKTIEEGGFDEVEARNYLLNRMYEQNPDWLLLCDSDEYFTSNTVDVIRKAEKQKATCVYLECWPYIPSRHVLFKAARMLQGLHDPHIRLIKATAKASFKRNAGQSCINQSAHCVPSIDPYEEIWIKGIFHIHMFASLNAKAARVTNMIHGKQLDIDDLIRLDESFKIPKSFELLHLCQANSNQYAGVDVMMMANSYGSHHEILRLLTEGKDIVVFEEGMGYHSTPVFLKHCKELYSAEYSKNFYEMMIKYVDSNLLFSRKCPWHPKFVESFDDVEEMINKANLVFVDGGIISIRHQVAISALKANKDYVILHDWEHPKLYLYDRIDVPKHYHQTIFKHKNSKVETMVFSLKPLDITVDQLEKNNIYVPNS
jgi:hypothetical protein